MDELPAWPIIQDCGCRDQFFLNACSLAIKVEILECAFDVDGPGWQLIHLPTHPVHFYDVHRYDFTSSVEGVTNGSCHIMSVVEGESVILETANGKRQRFNYAETFVVPAAAGRYTLTSDTNLPVKVIKAFVKETLPETL